MATFVDVAQVRIQAYLARSTDLVGRRGASHALAEATGQGAVSTLIRDNGWRGVAVNEAAGDVDGQVSLRLEDGAPSPEEVARTVLRHFRDVLPAVEAEASWGSGPSYVDAYRTGIKPGRAAGGVLSSRPALVDFPPARPCRRCQASAAERVLTLHQEEGPVALCADCLVRHQTGRDREVAGPEYLLHRHFEGRYGRAREFGELARLGLDRKRNHLATIFIDGNGLGDFFARLADLSLPPGAGGKMSGVDRLPTKDEVSRLLNDATWQALVAGTEACVDALAEHARTEREQAELARAQVGVSRDGVEAGSGPKGDVPVTLPVVPHVVGGDDVLVTVPASLAFTFTSSFLERYGTVTSDIAAQEGLVKLIGRHELSASAGIAFVHAKHPFRDSVELAQDLLRTAKAATSGRSASLAWQDVTESGTTRSRDRRFRRLAELAEGTPTRDALDAGRELRRRRRHAFETLRALAANPADHDEARRTIRRDRLDRRLLLDQAQGAPAAPGLDDLADILDLARWWYP